MSCSTPTIYCPTVNCRCCQKRCNDCDYCELGIGCKCRHQKLCCGLPVQPCFCVNCPLKVRKPVLVPQPSSFTRYLRKK